MKHYFPPDISSFLTSFKDRKAIFQKKKKPIAHQLSTCEITGTHCKVHWTEGASLQWFCLKHLENFIWLGFKEARMTKLFFFFFLPTKANTFY